MFKKLSDRDPDIRVDIRVPRRLGRLVAVHSAYQTADPEVQCHIECASFFLPWRNSLQWAKASLLSRIHDHTQTHHTR
jgi:hypothetical protein